MGNGESNQSSPGSGGWSVYKNLVMRLLETCVSDVRELFGRLSKVEEDLSQLRQWVRDNDAKAEEGRERVVSVEIETKYLKKKLAEIAEVLEKNANMTGRIARRHAPSPGLAVEIWRHPAGKLAAVLLALALVLGTAAAYNAVSIAQVDINQHLPRDNP